MKKRQDQRVCSSCRARQPARTIEEGKDRQFGATVVRAQCLGAGEGEKHQSCEKEVVRPLNRRGPLRCPDRALAHKRFVTTKSLNKMRGKKKATLDRIENTPLIKSGPGAARPEKVGTVDPSLVVEATAKARRLGHALAEFKASSAGAGSALIARCKKCETYVTIGHDGKLSGPGLRHDCVAATDTALEA